MTEVASTDAASSVPTVNRHAALRSVFESFRTTLDDQNERRERIIVSSRQVTSLSKKVIFHLLRISLIPRTAADRDEQRAKTLAEADEKVEEILGWLRKCRDDLREADVSFWAYARNMSVFFCFTTGSSNAELVHLSTDLQVFRNSSRRFRSNTTYAIRH